MNRPKVIPIIIGCAIITVTSVVLYTFPQLNADSQRILFIGLFVLLTVLLLSVLLTGRDTLPGTNESNNTAVKRLEKDVLIVDDNPANIQTLRTILNQWSLVSVGASNGHAALTLQQQNRFKMILLNPEMPKMNGMKILQAIRHAENNSHLPNQLPADSASGTPDRVPVIAVSAHDEKDIKIRALAAGFDDYLTRPVNQNKLRAIVQRWLHTDSALSVSLFQDDTKNIDKLSDNGNTSFGSAEKTAQPKFGSIQRPETKNISPVTRNRLQGDTGSDKKTREIVDVKQSLVYSHNDPQLAKDMMAMLIAMVAKERGRMIFFHRKKDWKNLGQLAHRLSGGSCYCGVPELYRQSRLIDEAIQKDAFEIAEHSFKNLGRAMDELLQWYQKNDLDTVFRI